MNDLDELLALLIVAVVAYVSGGFTMLVLLVKKGFRR